MRSVSQLVVLLWQALQSMAAPPVNCASGIWLVGLAKAPVFALIIVVVGCYQGFRTQGGADSVGRQTTRSVVQSIFMVIVADALFSVVFSLLDL